MSVTDSELSTPLHSLPVKRVSPISQEKLEARVLASAARRESGEFALSVVGCSHLPRTWGGRRGYLRPVLLRQHISSGEGKEGCSVYAQGEKEDR